MATRSEQIFINLPVKDLQATVAFFTELGYEFNPQFTDENATQMLIGDNIFAMLLKEDFFQTSIKKASLTQQKHAKSSSPSPKIAAKPSTNSLTVLLKLAPNKQAKRKTTTSCIVEVFLI